MILGLFSGFEKLLWGAGLDDLLNLEFLIFSVLSRNVSVSCHCGGQVALSYSWL